jgi:hypothetical protein
MVQCAVGFRCPACAGKFQSHAVKTTPWILIRTGLAAAVVGAIYGVASPSFGFGWGMIVTYIIGVVVGKGLHRIAAYKLGPKIVATVALSLFIGFASSSLPAVFGMVAASATAGAGAHDFSNMLSSYIVWHLVGIGIFIAGCLSPFLYR